MATWSPPLHASDSSPSLPLQISGGCERTAEQWRALLAVSGFRLEEVKPLAGHLHILTAKVV